MRLCHPRSSQHRLTLPRRWRPVRAEALIALRFGAGGKITAHAHAGSWASLIWAPLWQVR